MTEKIPCPYDYAKGKRCTGHIVGVEAFKADISWVLRDGRWVLNWGQPRSHFHLLCSERHSHAGFSRPDSDQMKFYYDQLPDALRAVVDANLIERLIVEATIKTTGGKSRR